MLLYKDVLSLLRFVKGNCSLLEKEKIIRFLNLEALEALRLRLSLLRSERVLKNIWIKLGIQNRIKFLMSKLLIGMNSLTVLKLG
jgi:hypothetical protein